MVAGPEGSTAEPESGAELASGAAQVERGAAYAQQDAALAERAATPHVPGAALTVRTVAELTPSAAGEVLALAAAVAAHDHVEAFGEQALLTVKNPSRSVRHVTLQVGAVVVGYAQLDDGSAELAIAPGHRGRGLGRTLLAAVLAEPGVRVWAHGDLPAARALAAAAELRVVRDLWLMTAPPPAVAEVPAAPAGVRVRGFEVGRDEDAWVAVNARAFAEHAEQGRMVRADLDARMAEPWFDPEVFWLAEEMNTGRILGSMWVKIAGDVGEIYALGIDPDAQGMRLGSVLTAQAMAAFASRGLVRLELYVEGENTPAIRTYQRAGFTKERADVQYANGRLPR